MHGLKPLLSHFFSRALLKFHPPNRPILRDELYLLDEQDDSGRNEELRGMPSQTPCKTLAARMEFPKLDSAQRTRLR